MEFYKIGYENGKYALLEDEDDDMPIEAAELTQEQLGLLADRLGSMYHSKNLVLTMRKYIMLYYTNDVKEYVSLYDIPSLVISEQRLKRKYGEGVAVDGFAITFLDGDEENRVMLSSSGDIEARGMSIIEVWQMLDELVDGLNVAKLEDLTLWQGRYSGNMAELRKKVADYCQENEYTNQGEITWYWAQKDGELISVDMHTDIDDAQKLMFELPTKGGHLRLLLEKDGQISLCQHRYDWQCIIDTDLWRNILSELEIA